MAVASNLVQAIKRNGVKLVTNVVPTVLTSGSAVKITATQTTPIGGKIYEGLIAITTADAAQAVTVSLYGSLDGESFYALTAMKQGDLSTNATVSGDSTTPIPGLYDLSKFDIPYWYLGATAAGTCVAHIQAYIVLP